MQVVVQDHTDERADCESDSGCEFHVRDVLVFVLGEFDDYQGVNRCFQECASESLHHSDGNCTVKEIVRIIHSGKQRVKH